LSGLVHVIDDDASFRTAIERRLKFAGYEVETYSSGQQLLDRLPNVEKPGCILLDVQIGAIERAMVRFESASNQRSELDAFRGLVTTLTPRERQVFGLIVRGKINKQIAYELGTTERTVKAHRHEVMEKMQVNSLAALVSIAERLNLLDHEA
jgi:FixJ family two-component response regulator